MKLSLLSQSALRMGTPLLAAAFLSPIFSPAQEAKPAITLDPQPSYSRAMVSHVAGEPTYENAPANFRSFRSVKAGEVGDAEPLTLRFSVTTKLTRIDAGKDFRVEQGSSCVEGNVYEKGASCNLLVRFTPQGPGSRMGKVKISHTASATPFSLGLGGYGYAPVLSFTPSVITTVAASYPGALGLMNGAQNLAVDGGDTLYVADTGNNAVRLMDASGAFTTIASGYPAPWGVAVDTFGQVYFSQPAANVLREVYDYGPVIQVNGTGTGACTASTPCNIASHTVTSPGALSIDNYNHLFFTEASSGAAMSTVQPVPANLIFLYDPFPYQTSPQSAMAADNNDNLYSFWTTGGNCQIVQQSLYNAENNSVIFNKVAGGHTCGFAGDGGQARNAQIGASIGQIAFDAAGDLYFTDTKNQRVRRIDYVTGNISTIAGNGTAGYGGDNAQATGATLASPTGVAVDSLGQVYILSGTAATGTAQVIRKVNTTGVINFGNRVRGTVIGPSPITLTNTGNSTLTFTNASFTGANASDFKIDPATTSCMLTAGSTLASGQSCKVGIFFTAAATGSRNANLVFADNTVTGLNTVSLSGVGVLPTPTLAIASPATGSSFAAGTSILFKATVTSASGAAPTGTVKFTLDGTVINAGVTLASGAASLNAVVSAVGSHTIAMSYSGDSNYAATGPVSRTFTVTAPAVIKSGPIRVRPVLPGGPVQLHWAPAN
ncbi:MAG TPA: Ig-like domain repeat protein [Acidobacteriaceae bacterium]|nr:Ig-like domain repeat protein [Acidobacteriaceae bacterium]